MTDMNAYYAETMMRPLKAEDGDLQKVQHEWMQLFQAFAELPGTRNMIHESFIIDYVKAVSEIFPRFANATLLYTMVSLCLGYNDPEDMEDSKLAGHYYPVRKVMSSKQIYLLFQDRFKKK